MQLEQELEEKERKKKEACKDVLTYPKGTDHLKYFEKIPHPERFSDKELAYLKSYSSDDLNVNSAMRRMEFEAVRKRLGPKLSALDEKLMRLPDRMQELMD